MPIQIHPLKPGGTHMNLKTKRFKRPTGGELAFDTKDRTPTYGTHVVQIVKQEGDKLQFKPIHKSDGHIVEQLYEVDLTKVRHVWRDQPSTLREDADPTADAALLFLSQEYVDELPDAKRRALVDAQPQVLGDCTKWPCYKGVNAANEATIEELKKTIENLQSEKTDLIKQYADLKTNWDRLKEDVSKGFDNLAPGES